MSSVQDSDLSKMKGMLTDVTKCIGCERCVEACVRKNKLPRDFLAYFKGNDGLSGNRFTSIVKTKEQPSDQWRMVRRHCLHCLEPSCQAACLVGALKKTPDGAVEYDADMCIGCRYCMLACPFSIPRYQYDQPLPYIRKCKMNDECRVKGGKPACVSACPTGATIFGRREDLLRVAKDRIAANPRLYIDHVFGEHEFGGTSVMYLSDVPLYNVLKMPSREQFDKMRVSSLSQKSVPALVEPWVWVTPVQFFTVSAGLGAIWLFRRRSLLMNKQNTDVKPEKDMKKEGSDGNQ